MGGGWEGGESVPGRIGPDMAGLWPSVPLSFPFGRALVDGPGREMRELSTFSCSALDPAEGRQFRTFPTVFSSPLESFPSQSSAEMTQ